MKRIKRNIIAEQIEKTAEHNKDDYLPYSQASFNSDGNIILRNYDRSDKSKDEIIMLSRTETTAVLSLFSKIGQLNKNYTLPF